MKLPPRMEMSLRRALRTGAADYTRANRVSVPLESLIGAAPVQATIYELERLRCNLCGKIFTAEPPEACQKNKHDETVGSIIALLKYGGVSLQPIGEAARRVRHTPCGFNSVGHCQ